MLTQKMKENSFQSAYTLIKTTTRQFHEMYPRILAILVGIILATITLLCIEGICYVLTLYKANEKPIRRDEGEYTNGYFEYDENLGYKPKPGVQVSSIAKYNEKTVYNVVYSIDQYSRRITPVNNRAARTEFALFFGCSYTIGQGVNDHETMPYYFAEIASRYIPYNYGFHGYGPQQMLAKLQSETFTEEIQERKGILIYTYVEGHVDRAIGAMYVHNAWGANMPFYALDSENRLIRKGSLTSGRPLISFLYSILAKSYFIKYFKIDFPININDYRYQLTGRIIEESYHIFRKKFNSENFYVVMYPSRKPDKKIIAYLENAGIKYFDYSNIFDSSQKERWKEYWIEFDGHPSAKAHQTLAERLARDISLLESR